MLKRPRSTTPVSSDCSDSSSDASSPRATSKYTRLPSSLPEESLKCTLPPLCSSRPTFFSTVGDLERHYAKIHELVCEAPVGDVGGRGKGKGREKTCGKVFPERRYLELHQNEFHNPLLEIERDQGNRTYECFLPPSACPRKFLTVKARRLHLVDAHRFPTDFYFAIIKFGINSIIESHGPAASLIRPSHSRPSSQPRSYSQTHVRAHPHAQSQAQCSGGRSPDLTESGLPRSEIPSDNNGSNLTHPSDLPREKNDDETHGRGFEHGDNGKQGERHGHDDEEEDKDEEMQDLIESIRESSISLAFVPRSISRKNKVQNKVK